MATNDTTLNTMSGGDKIRDYDDGTRKWPVGFIAFGDVTGSPIATPTVVQTANPLPVTVISATLGTVTVSGTVTANAGTGTLATTVANTVTVQGTVTTNVGTGTRAVSIASPLGQATMASSLPVVIASNQTGGTLGVNIAQVNGATPASAVSSIAAGTAPPSCIVMGMVYNSSPPAPTNTQTLALQSDSAGNLLTKVNNTVTVTLTSTTITGTPTVSLANLEVGLAAATAPSKMIIGGAQHNTTLPTPTNAQTVAHQCNQAGSLRVDIQNVLNAFSISGVYSPSATNATDIFTIVGSASKTIKITKVSFSFTATADAFAYLYGLKRTSANTSNAITLGTPFPYDAGSATATCFGYTTSNATTLGTSAGIARISDVLFAQTPGVVTVTNAPDRVLWDFSSNPVVLRGTAQLFAINANATTLPSGATLYVWAEWTEDDS